MTDQELLAIDLRKPHERVCVNGTWIKFKHTKTEEGVFYIPSFISLMSKERIGWRVRMARANPPFSKYVGGDTREEALYNAWRLVLKTLLGKPLKDKVARPILESIPTGVIGVRLNMAKPGVPRTFMLRVGQSTTDERAHTENFYSLGKFPLTRRAFNQQYARAIAARHYYLHLRNTHYRLDSPITRDTKIPREFFPKTLPVPDLFDQLLAAMEE